MFNDLRPKMIIGFVDSGGITDHHRCILYLEITRRERLKERFSQECILLKHIKNMSLEF